MAKIGSYENAPSPVSAEDKLIGTDSVNNDATKNFTIQEIADFVLSSSYTSYVANISQSGSSQPVVYVMENTTGANITISKVGPGNYFVSSDTPIFSVQKTFFSISQPGYSGLGDIRQSAVVYYSETDLIIQSYINGEVADSVLSNASLEIRNYP